MRSNLVFHNIPDTGDYSTVLGNVNDNYNNVKSLIAKYIHTNLEMDYDYVEKSIVRAHRSRPKATLSPNSTKPLPIFVKFARDDIAAEYLRRFIQINISNGRSGEHHRVEQQYTKDLQDRRRKAFQHRKELIESGDIVKGRVIYPATLKVIYPNTKIFVEIQKH